VAGAVLTSKWGSLSEAVQAAIFAVDQTGAKLTDSPTILAPYDSSSAQLESSANWQSPFEQAGPESRLPSLVGMLQSGMLESYAVSLYGAARSVGLTGDGERSSLARLRTEISEFARNNSGRTGMTKVNSTQLFTGAAPIKISLTLQFSAFDDPASEVHAPIDQLMQWHLAEELSADGALASGIQGLAQGQGFIKSFLPSRAPQMVGLRMGGLPFISPMVIEQVSIPVGMPRAPDGSWLRADVQLTLGTLTAMDSRDWGRMRRGQQIRMFTNQ
jgi:hypothetical protein